MKGQLLLGVFLLISILSNAQFWKVSDPIRLGGSVNTEAEESIPVFSKDSSILYFVRTYDKSNKGDELDQDIWQSTQESEDSYGECSQVKSLNNKFNNAVLGINKDGTVMYVLNAYDGKKDLTKGLARSQKDGNGDWSKPEKVDIPGLDIEGDFYGFHVSEDETVMIISYAGPGTLGEEDLYVSVNNGSSWSAPQHMGSRINSVGYEISPFLSKSKDTLYFSSTGHGGIGDADIFYSVKQGSWTEWGKPINLGEPINTPKFDAYFIHSGSQAYWSSNRDSELSDIYLINILTPTAVTIACSGTDATRFNGTDGMVDASVDGGVAPYTYSWSNGASTEDLASVGKGEYTVTVTDALGQTASSTCSVDHPAEPDNLALKHYFDYNADKLTTENGKLKNFVETIQAQLAAGRESITIDIESSASFVPTRTFKNNDELAKSRGNRIANELRDYFQTNGTLSKVTINITKSVVQGPKYEKDFENQAKYRDYQYIDLKTK